MAKRELTSGRTRRALKMGELASQVGTSYLWTSLRGAFLDATRREKELLEAHIRNARRIVESSTQLRGAFMKLIQMLAMRRDLLPTEALEVLRTTQSGVEPMDYQTISEQVRRELGKSPEQLYASFERTGFAAASLGQVHRARLKDGREVAVKIQYPGIDSAVREDLQNLRLLLKTLGGIARDVMHQKVDTGTIYGELEARLKEELDYQLEARNMTEFGRLFADDPEVMIPELVRELSSRRVLTMTYIDGYPLTDALNPEVELELRRWVAHKCSELTWREILEFGVLHTDFHPGNYLITHHPRIGILDFGSVRRFSEPDRKAYLQVARGIVDGDDAAIGAGMAKLGYIDPDQDPAPMVEIIHILFEPMYARRGYDPRAYDTVAKAQKVGEIAFKHKLYKSPDHSVFLLRALIGLEGIISQLGVKDDYRSGFIRCVERAAASR